MAFQPQKNNLSTSDEDAERQVNSIDIPLDNDDNPEPENETPAEEYYRLLSYASLFRNIHGMLDIFRHLAPKQEEYSLTIFKHIEDAIFRLNEQFRLNLSNNRKLHNYLRNHFGYNVGYFLRNSKHIQSIVSIEDDIALDYYFPDTTTEEPISIQETDKIEDAIKQAIVAVEQDLTAIFSNQKVIPPIKPEFIRNAIYSKELFLPIEVFKLSNMIEGNKKQHINAYQQEIGMETLEKLTDLFHAKYQVNQILVQMVVDKTEHYFQQNPLLAKLGVQDHSQKLGLYKETYQMVYKFLLPQYDSFVIKTIQHFLKLDSNGREQFQKKFQQGIPFQAKLEQELDSYVQAMFDIMKSQIFSL